MRHRRINSDLMLLLAAGLWGSAFVAQRIAAAEMGVFLFNGLRFLLGALLLLPFTRVFKPDSLAGKGLTGRVRLEILLLGFLLFAASALQQAGLRYTTAGNAAFITGLYVVFIPIVSAVFLGQRPRPVVWPAALLELAGLYLLSGSGSLKLNPGDLFELSGAVVWALQVILLGRLVQLVPVFTLTVGQSLVCMLFNLAASLLFERSSFYALAMDSQALLTSAGAVVYTGVFSVAVAYTLQAAAQRVSPPADAAILLSLEAVFAALFGWIFLQEYLTPLQILGCTLMFSAALLAQIPQLLPARKPAVQEDRAA